MEVYKGNVLRCSTRLQGPSKICNRRKSRPKRFFLSAGQSHLKVLEDKTKKMIRRKNNNTLLRPPPRAAAAYAVQEGKQRVYGVVRRTEADMRRVGIAEPGVRVLTKAASSALLR